MKILVANLGSTSLKWRLFDFSNGQERLLHKGGFERVTDYPKAIEDCLAQLKDAGHIQSERDLAAVGFKTIMAHGVNGCVRLDERVLKAMEAYNGIAPAHNPPYITGIRLFAQRMPAMPLVGLFETAFYQWAPEAAMRYAVPRAWHELGVRRWGFHGASHKFIAERSAELLGREDVAERARQLYVDGGASPVRQPDLRVISCHLGGSSSITGILNGVAIGTSMGMSPQSGLPQNNRVGDLDSFVAAVPDALHRPDARRSRTAHVQGIRSKGALRRLQRHPRHPGPGRPGQRPRATGAGCLRPTGPPLDWPLFLQLNGADALVFTAGIGENQPEHSRGDLREPRPAGHRARPGQEQRHTRPPRRSSAPPTRA